MVLSAGGPLLPRFPSSTPTPTPNPHPPIQSQGSKRTERTYLPRLVSYYRAYSNKNGREIAATHSQDAKWSQNSHISAHCPITANALRRNAAQESHLPSQSGHALPVYCPPLVLSVPVVRPTPKAWRDKMQDAHLTSPHLTSSPQLTRIVVAMALKYQASCWAIFGARHE